MSCPESMVWVSWWEGTLDPSEGDVLQAHLASCPACFEELTALARAQPEAASPASRAAWRTLVMPSPASRKRVLAAAAAVLLVAGIWSLSPWKRPGVPEPSPAPLSPEASSAQAARPFTPGPVAAEAMLELVAGPSGELALLPGAHGRVEASAQPCFTLESGEAWVESKGGMLRLRFPEGELEVSGGLAAVDVRAAAPALSWFIREAHAAEKGSCRVAVFEGEAVLSFGGEKRTLKAGESWPSPWRPEDPRGWKRLSEEVFTLRDAVKPMLETSRGGFSAEVLLRKRERTAEADLLFQGAGKGWRVPLGMHLRADGGWVRTRLECGGGRVRILAAGREILSAREGDLGTLALLDRSSAAFALRAWGGDLEVRGGRWKPR